MTRPGFYEQVNISPTSGETVSENKVRSPFSPDKELYDYPYTRISPLHRRSFENDTISDKVLWEDEFGHRYMSKSIKGIPPDGELPFLEEDPCTESGVRAHFLCDAADAQNTVRASDLLRESGLPTENIVKVTKLNSLSVNLNQIAPWEWHLLDRFDITIDKAVGEYIELPIDALKELMIFQLDVKIRAIRDGSDTPFPKSITRLAMKSDKELEELKNHIRQTDYYYYERNMPSNIRCLDLDMAESRPGTCCVWGKKGEIYLGREYFPSLYDFKARVKNTKEDDLYSIKDLERLIEIMDSREESHEFEEVISSDLEFKQMLKKVFHYFNIAEGMRLNPDNPKDIAYYYAQLLPSKMGDYLGKLHNLGLIHKYPGDKNWLAIGYLVDLDSVSGAALGDPPIDIPDISADLFSSLYSLYLMGSRAKHVTVYDRDKGKDIEYSYDGHVVDILDIDAACEISKSANINFLRAYAATRHMDSDELYNLLSTVSSRGAATGLDIFAKRNIMHILSPNEFVPKIEYPA